MLKSVYHEKQLQKRKPLSALLKMHKCILNLWWICLAIALRFIREKKWLSVVNTWLHDCDSLWNPTQPSKGALLSSLYCLYSHRQCFLLNSFKSNKLQLFTSPRLINVSILFGFLLFFFLMVNKHSNTQRQLFKFLKIILILSLNHRTLRISLHNHY